MRDVSFFACKNNCPFDCVLDIVIEKVVFLPNFLPEIFQFWIWTYSPQLPKICPNVRHPTTVEKCNFII